LKKIKKSKNFFLKLLGIWIFCKNQIGKDKICKEKKK